MFNLFSLFSTEASAGVEIEKLLEIRIGGQSRPEVAYQIGVGIGDLVVLAALRRDLKAAHRGYQAFGDLFDDEWRAMKGLPAYESAKADSPNSPAHAELLEHWFEKTTGRVYTDRYGMIENSVPSTAKDDTRYPVLVRMMEAAKDTSARGELAPSKSLESTLASVLRNGTNFITNATKVSPRVRKFENALEKGRLAELPRLVREVVTASRLAAQSCDTLMKDAGYMMDHTVGEMKELLPGEAFDHVPALRTVTP